MKKILIFISAILLFQIIGISSSIPELLKPIKIAENLYAIENPRGGNIAFLVTEEGIIVVDAGSIPSNGMQIIYAIQSVSEIPIKYLIYTHLHSDHIYGASAFPSDVKIIAHKKLVENLKAIIEPELKKEITDLPNYISSLKNMLDSIPDKKSNEYLKINKQFNLNSSYLEELKTIQIRYPDITFADKYELTLGNEKVILEFPGSGHTNDNIIVRFPKQNAIHAGDLIFNGIVPYVIAEHGATVNGWTKITEKLSLENIKSVIPGHGTITSNEAFKIQTKYFNDLTFKIKELKNQGLSLIEIKTKNNLSDFKLRDEGNQLPVNIEAIYNEL